MMTRVPELGLKTLVITIALFFAAISLPDVVFSPQIFATPVYESQRPPGTGTKRIVFIVGNLMELSLNYCS